MVSFDIPEDQLDRNKGVLSAEVISVIRTKISVGDGTKGNPFRQYYQYWSLDGEILATKDDLKTIST